MHSAPVEPTENDIVVEAWNTVLFDKFSRFKHLLVNGLSNHSDNLLSRVNYSAGASVIDIGCGFGDTTLRLAEIVGPDGLACGVDCAVNFIAECNTAREAGSVKNARFLVADVQYEKLGGPYDYAFGRFGTMFFNMPGAAMNNIRKHLKPGGRLDMIVWRKREDNPWLYDAECRVREIVPIVDHSETDQVHCGPGPFSMSGPDMVSSMLISVGFEDVRFERFDADICIGRNVEEAVAFAMTLGPAGEIIRLAGDEGIARTDEVIAGLTEVMEKYSREDGVWAPSSTWFVSASNPA
ncbi:MAG: class I SAM-dependent methyltransferase [Proteobacteria bacterium]|nr:class I SAM-dependent methyltransferase [Pseudomonadota bacterium]MDA0928645.1 class I SAM-dependent methyltransferase [Pseudomonadota bacterium]